MAESLWIRLRDVSWTDYPCSPRSKVSIPKTLENLSSRKESRAMKASHDLWTALCSGGVAPAAVPTLPFLVEIFDISSDSVQSELLDIFIKFAQPLDGASSDVEKSLQQEMIHALPFFKGILHSRDEGIVSKANALLDLLNKPS